MYEDRRRDYGETKLAARQRVGQLLDINPATLRNWVEREEIDTGVRPGVTSEASAELKALRKANAELRRANEIQRTASVFRIGGARPPTRVIVDYIDAHQDRFGVEPICRLLTEHGVLISPSTPGSPARSGPSATRSTTL
jgi:transposase-like protein